MDTYTIGVVGCAPASDTSACPYDSGAPYFAERSDGTATLVAIENHGPACPHSQMETAARVDKVAGCIREHIG